MYNPACSDISDVEPESTNISVNDNFCLHLESDEESNTEAKNTEGAGEGVDDQSNGDKDSILNLLDSTIDSAEGGGAVCKSRKREKITNVEERREMSMKKKARKDLDGDIKVKLAEYKKLSENLKSLTDLVQQCNSVKDQVQSSLLKCGVPSNILDKEEDDSLNVVQSGEMNEEMNIHDDGQVPSPVQEEMNIRKDEDVDSQVNIRTNDTDESLKVKSGFVSPPPLTREKIPDIVESNEGRKDNTSRSGSPRLNREKSPKNMSPIVINPIKGENETSESSDSDIVYIGMDYDTNVAQKKKMKADLTKVKTEKGVPGSSRVNRKTLKRLITKDEHGKILYPFKCGLSFTTANNMYIHIEREVCQKDLKERNMIRCRFKDCKHETVTESAMHNHEMGHLGLKDYVCPVPSCGQSFSHGSSLINHKYGLHYNIFKPPKS